MSGYVKNGYAPGGDVEGSGPNGELLASDILNDSLVSGLTVREALNALLAGGGGIATLPKWYLDTDLTIPLGQSYIIDQLHQEDGVTITQEDGGHLIIL